MLGDSEDGDAPSSVECCSGRSGLVVCTVLHDDDSCESVVEESNCGRIIGVEDEEGDDDDVADELFVRSLFWSVPSFTCESQVTVGVV